MKPIDDQRHRYQDIFFMRREMNIWFCGDSFTSIKQISFALLIPLILALGCNRESTTSRQIGQKSGNTYTEAQLNELITPGMNASELEKRFGSPGSKTEISSSFVMWTYLFPLTPNKPELHLGGFSVDIKDGKVERWTPIMEESRQTLQAGGAQGSFGEQFFQIFLATDSLTNVANTVDANGSTDSSNLSAPPDLEFKAKVFAGNSGMERPGEHTVILVLNEQDALKLKEITEKNFGKRLLIVSRSQVIAAPVISSPLASRQFMFTTKTSTGLSNIQGK